MTFISTIAALGNFGGRPSQEPILRLYNYNASFVVGLGVFSM
jgi:hypothetical protein